MKLPKGYRLVKRGRFHIGDKVCYWWHGCYVWEKVEAGCWDLRDRRDISDGWYAAVARKGGRR